MIQMEMRENYGIYITHVDAGLAEAEQRSRPTVEEQWLLALYQDSSLGAAGLGNSHTGAQQGDPESHAELIDFSGYLWYLAFRDKLSSHVSLAIQRD
jgi:hypothetical protein